MYGHVSYVLVAVVVFLGSQCSSQLSVRSMLLRSHIRYRFATTVVTSTVINDDPSASREALFEMVLPEEAFISNFSMTVDGEVYPGRVEEKKSAMKAYQTAKQQGQSAGYIKTTARHSNKFDVSVNLKPGSEVTFNLTYQQLLVRCHGMYEHKMHVNPGRVVRDLKVEVFLEEIRPITKLETSMKKELENNVLSEDDVTVEDPSPLSRYIVYNPSREQQKKAGEDGISGEFLVKYDVERTKSTGEVLVVDGYFLHFVAPENFGELTSIPKDIVFVLDISGSMSGTKIRQLKEAMKTILDEMSNKDTFNIFSFNDALFRWRGGMTPVTSDTIREAMQYVNRLEADDSTDINKALTGGVEFLLNNRDRNHVPLVFFLTDGQPTSGVKDPASIANNVERNNEGVSSVFGLAFGSGADYNLMKVVSVQNGGFARKIYEAADASQQVKGFYDEISSTMMQNLTINYMEETVQKDTLTPTTFGNVFRGNDIVIAGRGVPSPPHPGGCIDLRGRITAKTSRGTINLILDNDTDGIMLPPDPQPNPYFKMPVDFASVTEKTWAYLTIKELLKQKKKATYKKKEGVDDLDKRILEMSLKYKFVTPLTSMVATKPEEKASQATIEGDEYEHKKQYSSYSHIPSSLGSQRNAYIARGIAPALAGPSGISGYGGVMYNFDGTNYRTNVQRYQSMPGRKKIRRKQYPMTTRPGKELKRSGYTTTAQPSVHIPTTRSPIVSMRGTKRPPSDKRKISGGRRRKTNQRRRKPKTCRIVKVMLDGYGTTVNNKTKCVKVKRVQSGTFLLYPDRPTNDDFSVQAIFAGGKRRPNLVSIKVILKTDDVTYELALEQGISSTTWRSPDSDLGHVTIQKHVTCKGRRGRAKVFVTVHPKDQQTGVGVKIKRDLKKRIRISSRKAKKMNSSFRECDGRIAKEHFSSRSQRVVADGESLATNNSRHIQL